MKDHGLRCKRRGSGPLWRTCTRAHTCGLTLRGHQLSCVRAALYALLLALPTIGNDGAGFVPFAALRNSLLLSRVMAKKQPPIHRPTAQKDTGPCLRITSSAHCRLLQRMIEASKRH